MNTNSSTKKDHFQLLAEMIEDLENEALGFYEISSSWKLWAWHIMSGIAFLSSVATALVAALMKDTDFSSYGKPLLVVVPVVGAAATGILHLYKFREKEALREEGRIEVEDIIANAKSILAASSTENDVKVGYHQVRERFMQLEKGQHRRDIALRSDEIPRIKP